MLKEANTDHFNPLVPKGHNSECPNLLFTLQITPVKVLKLVCIFFSTLYTNVLNLSHE